MTKKFERIKATPEARKTIEQEVASEFGTCTRDAVFDALAFRVNSKRAMYIRQRAYEHGGILVKEERFV